MSGVEYMAFYPRDWLEGTFGLTPEQRAYYIDLIAHIADTGNQLRDDDQYVAGLLRTKVRRWRRVKRELTDLGKIFTENGHLFNLK